MDKDFTRFCQNRQIFPNYKDHSSNQLICGHINRLKFPANIQTYIENRKNKVSMISSLGRSNRCFCRSQGEHKDAVKEQLNRIELALDQTKSLVTNLEGIQIVLPKDKIFKE